MCMGYSETLSNKVKTAGKSLECSFSEGIRAIVTAVIVLAIAAIPFETPARS